MGGCVGHKRTEIMTKFTSGKTISDTRIIIGVDFAVHCIDLPENKGSAGLQIWDFGEEQRFRSLIPCFCQGAAGAILYFDLTKPETLYELEEWIYLIRSNTPDIPIMVCGTNYHLLENTGGLSKTFEWIQDFIQAHQLSGYRGISVKTEYNVTESFDQLTALMVQYQKSTKSPVSHFPTLAELLQGH
jgi:GTPase SAR1 family protein